MRCDASSFCLEVYLVALIIFLFNSSATAIRFFALHWKEKTTFCSDIKCIIVIDSVNRLANVLNKIPFQVLLHYLKNCLLYTNLAPIASYIPHLNIIHWDLIY